MTEDQRKVLEHKMKLEEIQKLKYGVELNKIEFDLKNQVSQKNLKFQQSNYEASIKIAEKNISEIKKLIKQGFEIQDQQASDTVSDQFKETNPKDRLKQKELPPEVSIKPPELE